MKVNIEKIVKKWHKSKSELTLEQWVDSQEKYKNHSINMARAIEDYMKVPYLDNNKEEMSLDQVDKNDLWDDYFKS